MRVAQSLGVKLAGAFPSPKDFFGAKLLWSPHIEENLEHREREQEEKVAWTF